MTEPAESTKFKGFTFDVEVSTWYHEYRRGALGSLVTCVRLVSLLGSIIALLAVSSWVETHDTALVIVAIASIVIGIVNLLDLIFAVDRRARIHDALYVRFKVLQSKIAAGRRDWEKHFPDWEAEAQAIRADEPPTYWALYNLCRNQTLKKYRLNGKLREIGFTRRLLRNWVRYSPDDFEVASGGSV